MPFLPFASWSDVRRHCARSGELYYHAPMDRYPVRVYVVRAFKNGKLRLRAANADADAFTADASHLDRCFRLARMIRIVYDVHEGRPSWHQQRAGHISAAVTSGFETYELAKDHQARLKQHHPDLHTFILSRTIDTEDE